MKNTRVTITTAGDVSKDGPISGFLDQICRIAGGYSVRSGDGCWVGSTTNPTIYSEPSSDIVVL